MPGHVNYLTGNDPSLWQTGVPVYTGITYRDLYPGHAPTQLSGKMELVWGTQTAPFNIKFNDSFCRFIENNLKITVFRSNFTSVKQTT